jgi:hypothetical protein
MNYRKQESLVPPDLLQVLLRPISEVGVALAVVFSSRFQLKR